MSLMYQWRDRIQIAKQNGEFSEQDKKDAQNWRVCSVGNLYEIDQMTRGMNDKRVNNNSIGEIIDDADEDLFDLGLKFSRYVLDDDPFKAEEIDQAIHACKAQLDARQEKYPQNTPISEYIQERLNDANTRMTYAEHEELVAEKKADLERALNEDIDAGLLHPDFFQDEFNEQWAEIVKAEGL